MTVDVARDLSSALTEQISPNTPAPQLRTTAPAPVQTNDVTQGLIAAFDSELTRAQGGQDHSALVSAYSDAAGKVGSADAAVANAYRKASSALGAVDAGPINAATKTEQQTLATPRLDNSAESLAAQQALTDKQAAIADAQRVARQKIISQAGMDPNDADSIVNQELNRIGKLRVSIQNQEKNVIGTAFATLLSGGKVGADAYGNVVGVSGLDMSQKQVEASYSMIRAASSAAHEAIPFAEMVAADSLGGSISESKRVAASKAVDDYNRAQNEVRAGKISDARTGTLLADATYNRQLTLAKEQGTLGVGAANATATSVKSMADYAIGAAKASIDKRSGILNAMASRIGMQEKIDKDGMEQNALYVANSKRVQLGMEPVTPAAFKMMQPKDKQQIMDQGSSVAFGGTFDESMGMIQSLGFNPERMKQEGNAKDAAQLQIFQQAIQGHLQEQMATGADGTPKHPEAYAALKKLTPEQRVRAVSSRMQDEWDFQSNDMSQATDDNPRKINLKTYATLSVTRPDLVKPLADAGVVDEMIKMNGPENIGKKDVLPKAFDALSARVNANPSAMDTEVKKFTDSFSMLTKMQAVTSGYPQYGLPYNGDYKVNVGGNGRKARVISFTNPAQIKAVLAVRSLTANPQFSFDAAPTDLPTAIPDNRTSIQRLADQN